ncbi:MAG: hypothetical protein ACYCXJ_02560 [Thermoleophilia bacterium]
MKKGWNIFAIWIVVSAVLLFGLLAMELNGCDTRTGGLDKKDSGRPVKEKDKREDDDSSGEKDKRKDDDSDKKSSRRDQDERDPADDVSDAGSVATVESVAAAVSAMRGLPLINPIEVSYLDRDELEEQIVREFEREYTEEEAEAEEKALRALDLLDPGIDLLETMQELLVDQVVGYYDDETKELALISEAEELDLMNEVTLSHEVTHALQDQSFNLTSFYPLEGPATADANFARLALVEGDASLAMTEYMETELSLLDMFSLGMSSAGDAGGLLGMSPYLEGSLMFPYVSGEEFVAYVKEQGGWEMVNGVYASPPESTEQIIHPEKYFEGDHPVYVEIPPLQPVSGPGWDLVYDDSFGEFDVVQLLSQGLDFRDAAAAGAGWGGGRYSLYERSDGAEMAVILLTWDNRDEADEFTAAMAEYLEWKYCSSFEFNERQFPVLESCEGGYWVMVRKGTAVLVARVPDRTLANILPAKILAAQPVAPGIFDNMQSGNMVAAISGLFDLS